MNIQPKRRHLLVVLVSVLTLSFASIALATATSGRMYKGENPIQPPNDICGEAIIRDVADNVGNTFSSSNGTCWSPVLTNPGVLGVRVHGYRDGVYCGSAGYVYNSSITSGIGVGSKLCSNPSGFQNFHSVSLHRVWNGSSYTSLGTVTSPSQTY